MKGPKKLCEYHAKGFEKYYIFYCDDFSGTWEIILHQKEMRSQQKLIKSMSIRKQFDVVSIAANHGDKHILNTEHNSFKLKL